MKPVVINVPVEETFREIMEIVDRTNIDDPNEEAVIHLRKVLGSLKRLYRQGFEDAVKEVNPN